MDPSPSEPLRPLDPGESSRLLQSLADGTPGAAEELVVRLHDELRRLAARHMAAQRPDHTLQASALVSEVWLRLFGRHELHFAGRRQFLRFASSVMRSVLVDHARSAACEKRGGGRQRVSISAAQAPAGAADPGEAVDLLDLDAALSRLKDVDPGLAQLVELRFFGGLSHALVAEVLGVTERTVERQWRLAKAWLFGELTR